jgi:hypothetical protein
MNSPEIKSGPQKRKGYADQFKERVKRTGYVGNYKLTLWDSCKLELQHQSRTAEMVIS